jgi:hypothetical protein
MKTKYREKIGDYTVISHISNVSYDTSETEKKIAPMLTSETTDEEHDKLFMDNLVLSFIGDEAEYVDDETASLIQEKLDSRGENRLLLDSGEYIDDYRGFEYNIKKSGKWGKVKIEDIGIGIPDSAVLQENLTVGQQKEIADQNEEKRKANLTPGEYARERISEIDRELAEINQKQARSSAEIAEALASGEPLPEEAVLFHKKREDSARKLRAERKNYALN